MFTDASESELKNKKKGSKPYRYKLGKLMVLCGILEVVNVMGDLNTRVGDVAVSVVVGVLEYIAV